MKYIFFLFAIINIVEFPANADSSNDKFNCQLYLQPLALKKASSRQAEGSPVEMEVQKFLDSVRVEIAEDQISPKVNHQEIIEFVKYNKNYLNRLLQKLNVQVLRFGTTRFNRLDLSKYPTDQELTVVEVQVRNLPLTEFIPGLKRFPFDYLILEAQFYELEDILKLRRLKFANE